ncbi:fimbrial protein [Burkholderia stagnalis]|uniref:fimbrial protein n=1 Tax=Burkholderia stagnalis TaxID=1503054 RepID=UPI000A96AFF9|nr:fimbrial protein [Burkholderia stagnalis]
MKRFIYASLLAVMLLMSGLASAQCFVNHPNETWNTGTPGEKPIVFTTPGFNVSINPNVPDGTVLFRKDLDFYNAQWGETSCPGGVKLAYFLPWNRSYQSGFHKTSIPGVVMNMWFTTNPGGGWMVYTPINADRLAFDPGAPHGYFGKISIQLVKRGAITAGGVIASGELGSMWGVNGFWGPLISWRIDGAIVVDPQVPTCRVSTPAITVPLGNVPASTFAGVGTPAPSKPFNIELECSGIETGKNLDVYTTLTDHTNPGNVSDTLTLAKDSTATGVGIQVLNGNTVVKYGPDSSTIGNKNQWKAGAAGNGTFTIPLTARYVQTAPKVTPGTANGLATFTMSYK